MTEFVCVSNTHGMLSTLWEYGKGMQLALAMSPAKLHVSTTYCLTQTSDS